MNIHHQYLPIDLFNNLEHIQISRPTLPKKKATPIKTKLKEGFKTF